MDGIEAPSLTVPKLSDLADDDIAIDVRELDLYFGERKVLHQISMTVPRNRVTAVIGQAAVVNQHLLGVLTA